ncbi:hypothetical protein Pmani_036331 [Petrolisthes manimaculis]|uniref:Uncharacterized protein n=1 Tax=Petrolisthes manimaculis TaxID=1843537 RepID=A0AAE1NJI9_9EUCA|nr:hypothetical protein Pmani_036331 [Petrolisthes manimaculis]
MIYNRFKHPKKKKKIRRNNSHVSNHVVHSLGKHAAKSRYPVSAVVVVVVVVKADRQACTRNTTNVTTKQAGGWLREWEHMYAGDRGGCMVLCWWVIILRGGGGGGC